MAGFGGRPARTCVSTKVTLTSPTSTTTSPGPARLGYVSQPEHARRPELADHDSTHGGLPIGVNLSDSDSIGVYRSDWR